MFRTLAPYLFLLTSLCGLSNFTIAQKLKPAKDGNLFGYRDSTSKFVIKPQYQYAQNFMNGYAIVALNDSLGAIDKGNKLIMPFKYEYLRYLGKDLFTFGYRGKYLGEYIVGIINTSGQIIVKPAYSYILLLNDRIIVSKSFDNIIGKENGNDLRQTNTKYGVLSNTGVTLIPCQYEYVSVNNIFL